LASACKQFLNEKAGKGFIQIAIKPQKTASRRTRHDRQRREADGRRDELSARTAKYFNFVRESKRKGLHAGDESHCWGTTEVALNIKR
jgi:hypothetical protein